MKKKCYKCNGNGYKDCYTCKGRRRNKCYTCHGKGFHGQKSEGRICKKCNGNRTVECKKCSGAGNKMCDKCHGSGYIKQNSSNSNSNKNNSNNSGGCFITTAVCQTIGKNDNCHELNTYRNFRDNWLSKTLEGQKKIETYYSIAPDIVHEINKRSDSSDIYRNLWENYLSQGLILLEEDKYNEALDLYENMLKHILIYLTNKN